MESLGSTWQWLIGLIVPAVVALAYVVGKLTTRVDHAHERIDRLEKTLSEKFDDFGNRLERSINLAWTNCPLAKDPSGEHKR